MNGTKQPLEAVLFSPGHPPPRRRFQYSNLMLNHTHMHAFVVVSPACPSVRFCETSPIATVRQPC